MCGAISDASCITHFTLCNVCLTQSIRSCEAVARSGDEFVITKNGRPTARLVPCRSRFRDWFGADRGSIEILGDIISPVDAEWEAELDPDRTLKP